MKTTIIPVVLTTESDDLSEKLTRLKGLVKRVQIDIIDGIFADNKTLSLEDLSKVKELADFEVEVHLMVKEPIGWLVKCKRLGIKRVTAQIEMMASQERFIHEAWDLDLKPGLALNLETEIEEVEPGLLTSVDQLLLMAVKVGFSGQKFNSQVLDKIKRIRELTGEEIEICVDGGINDQTAGLATAAGANLLAVNSFLWQDKTEKQIKKLEQLINEDSGT